MPFSAEVSRIYRGTMGAVPFYRGQRTRPDDLFAIAKILAWNIGLFGINAALIFVFFPAVDILYILILWLFLYSLISTMSARVFSHQIEFIFIESVSPLLTDREHRVAAHFLEQRFSPRFVNRFAMIISGLVAVVGALVLHEDLSDRYGASVPDEAIRYSVLIVSFAFLVQLYLGARAVVTSAAYLVIVRIFGSLLRKPSQFLGPVGAIARSFRRVAQNSMIYWVVISVQVTTLLFLVSDALQNFIYVIVGYSLIASILVGSLVYILASAHISRIEAKANQRDIEAVTVKLRAVMSLDREEDPFAADAVGPLWNMRQDLVDQRTDMNWVTGLVNIVAPFLPLLILLAQAQEWLPKP